MGLLYPTYTTKSGSRTSGKVTHPVPTGQITSGGYAARFTFWVKGCDSRLVERHLPPGLHDPGVGERPRTRGPSGYTGV